MAEKIRKDPLGAFARRAARHSKTPEQLEAERGFLRRFLQVTQMHLRHNPDALPVLVVFAHDDGRVTFLATHAAQPRFLLRVVGNGVETLKMIATGRQSVETIDPDEGLDQAAPTDAQAAPTDASETLSDGQPETSDPTVRTIRGKSDPQSFLWRDRVMKA